MAEERPRKRHQLSKPPLALPRGHQRGDQWRYGLQTLGEDYEASSTAVGSKGRGGQLGLPVWGARPPMPSLALLCPYRQGLPSQGQGHPHTCSEPRSHLPYPQTSGEGGGGRRVRKKATGGPEIILPGLPGG